MLEKYNRYKVLKIFLDNPSESFGLRELSRKCKISPPSVIRYLKEFEKENLIRKYEKNNQPLYKANSETQDFIMYNKLSILFELHFSGLIEYLWKELAPKAIILYGSYSKGEPTEDSDVDLFAIGKPKKIETNSFEKKLGKKIHLMINEEKKIPKHLKNNLINGIVLKGYFKAI